MECTNCKKEIKDNEVKRIEMNIGIALILQDQCPYCQCPIYTEIIKTD